MSDPVDDMVGIIQDILTERPPSPVADALAAIAAAPNESRALDVLWGDLASAAGRGDVAWCQEFARGLVAADLPTSVAYGLWVILKPMDAHVHEERLAFGKRCGKA